MIVIFDILIIKGPISMAFISIQKMATSWPMNDWPLWIWNAFSLFKAPPKTIRQLEGMGGKKCQETIEKLYLLL
jgi:hypothetical protein